MDISAASISALQASQTHAQLSTAVLKHAQDATEAEGEAVLELIEAVEQAMAQMAPGELDLLA